MGDKYRVAFANLLLWVERECDAWTVRISDLSGRETLHGATVRTLAAAKTEAVDFALSRLFGPGHNKDAARMAESLLWDPAS
jgi:hypothetical protein